MTTAAEGPRLRRDLAGFAGYAAPAPVPPGALPLDRNEPLAPPEAARAALHRLDAHALAAYPDGRALTHALAAHTGFDPAGIVLGNGSDELIDLVCRVALEPGTNAVFLAPTFPMYAHFVRLAGAVPRAVERPAPFAFDEGALTAAIDAETRLIIIAAPENPTGVMPPAGAVARIAAAHPRVLVLLDQAYSPPTAPDDLDLPRRFAGVIVTRSFSKLAGIAGLRLGAGYAPPALGALLNAVRAPYNVNAAALAAGEAIVAARTADAYARDAAAGRAVLTAALTELGTAWYGEAGTFVLAHAGDAAHAIAALAAGAGVLVKTWRTGALAPMLRITTPDAEAAAFAARTLRTITAPDAVLFDMDGILADEHPSYRACILAAARALGADTATAEDVEALKRAGGFNDDYDCTVELLRLRLSGPQPAFAEVVATFQRFYLGFDGTPGLCNLETLIPPADLVRSIARRYPVGIVTGRPGAEARAFLARAGLADVFSVIVSRDDVPVGKPDPTGLRMAAAALGGVQHAWYVGDSPDDMRAARRAGFLPVGVPAPSAGEGMDAVLYAAGAAWVAPSLAAAAAALR